MSWLPSIQKFALSRKSELIWNGLSAWPPEFQQLLHPNRSHYILHKRILGFGMSDALMSHVVRSSSSWNKHASRVTHWPTRCIYKHARADMYDDFTKYLLEGLLSFGPLARTACWFVFWCLTTKSYNKVFLPECKNSTFHGITEDRCQFCKWIC